MWYSYFWETLPYNFATMTRTVLLVIAHTVVAFAASAQAQTSSSSSSSGSSSSIRSSSATSTVASSTLTAPLSASSVSSISNYPFSTVNVATSVAAQNVTTATRATITGPPLTVFSTAATTIAFTAATTRTTSAAVATSTVLATATASASALPSASNAATTASASTTRSSSISTSAALTVAPSPSPTAVPSNCTIPGQFYQCGTCTFVTLADCRGTCPSSSTTSSSWYVRDCSGACVPQSVAAVIDQCGICGGTGSSCLDCNGVANGTSVRDGCGVCGGAGECNFSFKAMAPLVVPNTGAAMVDVFGTGFDILTAAVYTSAESTLQVLVNGALVPFSRIVSSTTSGIRFIMPAVSIPASATSTAAVVSLYLPLSRTTINDTLTVYASQVANSTTSTRLYRNRDSDLYMQISRLLAWPLPVTVAPIRPPVCQFGTISGILTSSVSLFGNSTLVCRVPSFPTSQPVTWGMILEQPVQDGYSNKTSLLYRQDLFVPYASSVSAVGQIDVYAPAPSVSYARFDNTGDSILVAFAVPIAARVQGSALATGTSVSVGLSSFATVNLWIPQPCSVVFVTNSATSGAANLTRAGVASDCSLILTDASTLKISVSSAATLSTVGDAYSLPITLPRIGSTLAVLPNTLYAASEAYADPFQGSIVIGPPLSPLRPTLVVRAPPSIGNCDNLVFDLSQVSNAGGRPFAAISVAFTSTVTTLRDPILTANLQTLAQTLLTGQYLLTVPASWLTARTYTFTFTLSNFLGGSATKTVQVIKTSTSDTPLLSLSGPSGPSSAGRAIDLSAQVVLPASCNASLQTGSSRTNSSWFYAWRYVSGGPLGFNGTASLSSILSSARLVLSIPPFSLSPGISNYTFAFSASNPSPGGGLGPVMTSGTIVIATAADVLWVSAGPNFAASADRSLVLSASFGSDSYAVPLSASVPLSFQWACLQAVSLDPCVDRRTNRTLVLASTAAVNVTGQLSPGVYAFTATVINTATDPMQCPIQRPSRFRRLWSHACSCTQARCRHPPTSQSSTSRHPTTLRPSRRLSRHSPTSSSTLAPSPSVAAPASHTRPSILPARPTSSRRTSRPRSSLRQACWSLARATASNQRLWTTVPGRSDLRNWRLLCAKDRAPASVR
ncbi:hypothetical protein BC831DRAFT_275504 [Entophlyctis helioformis]|nr:hypothetical protein BC831DRAFT_275504 [Entophlyctis helioformis]